MKKISRLSPPDCFDNNISKDEKIEYYQNTGKSKTINPRWNNICKDTDGISLVRKKLLEMSDNVCAFCGVRVFNESFDVEHFLPKDEFPYLAYCFENYLPCCKTCNQTRKKTFVPDSLKGKEIIEDILQHIFPNAEIYNHAQILQKTKDRIIEPTFDDIETHLVFNAELLCYDTKTKIGEITNRIFFDHKEVSEKWENISQYIKLIVFKTENYDELTKAFILIDGYEYVSLAFLDYWKKEKKAGRTR
ncbi:MAG: hypothetical protein EAZ85_03980 [Bacteroidetes bacterium]|nr:MAG: hypothetical protein EAZ85_03980 [Bacteroidota bacterium]TAG90703.1 MAG: hypothetical protein EAZ20_03715 [Bacteroidota bacterium]